MSRQPDKRTAILLATLKLIAERGFHGTPTSMIAERAGVGVGTIYRYFKDKDQLIHTLYEELEAKNKAFVYQGYEEERPVLDRFQHLCRNIYRYLLANPLEFRFLEQYFDSPYGVAKMRQKLDSAGEPFHALLKEGKRQGLVKDMPPTLLFGLIFGTMINVIKDHDSGLLKLDEVLLERLIEATWDAIKK